MAWSEAVLYEGVSLDGQLIAKIEIPAGNGKPEDTSSQMNAIKQ